MAERRRAPVLGLLLAVLVIPAAIVALPVRADADRSDAPAKPGTAATAEAPIRHEPMAPAGTPTEAPAVGTGPAPGSAEAPATPNRADAPAAAGPLVGSAPLPVGGKPTGPFSFAWSFVRDGDRANGTISVRNHASSPDVDLSIAVVGATRLESPARQTAAVPDGGVHAFPVTVRLGPGHNAIAVTATQGVAGGRARTVLIVLDPPPTAPAVPDTAAAGASPATDGALHGTRTLTDQDGQRIRFHPVRP